MKEFCNHHLVLLLYKPIRVKCKVAVLIDFLYLDERYSERTNNMVLNSHWFREGCLYLQNNLNIIWVFCFCDEMLKIPQTLYACVK